MIKLPTYDECAAVPHEKRTALERFIWANQPPNDEYPGMKTFRDQLTAVIEEERALHRPSRCAALNSVDPPQDCDAPFCGCNPEWTKCIEALQECGWEDSRSVDALRAERDALAAENKRMREALQLIASCTPIPGPSFSLVMSMTQVASRALVKEPKL